ncbi:IS1595 family transposase [candidate division WOR-3 bacterium]|nr:IS1595 family transposase [candidate division WOR-3 bacterium]
MNIVEIYKKFPTQEDCIAYLEEVKWRGKPQCPYCKSYKSTPLKKEKRHHCNNCNTSYSVTVRTIFHKTKLDFQKWFLAISLILNARKGISSRQLSRHLNINKDTAWYMSMRIRKAMLEERELMEGIVEMDEIYIGGKPRKGTTGKLKRGLVGQFHKVSVQYLPKYLDEFCYRYNNRENKNVFDLTISKALGV